MAGRPWLRWLLAASAAALAAPSVSAAQAPSRQTVEPPGLGVSFDLPSDWGPDLPPDPGWRWQAIAPGYTAHLYLTAGKATAPFSVLRARVVTLFRVHALASDAHASVSSKSIRVASNPAVEVVTRVHVRGPDGPTVVVDYTYAFVHGGLLYLFDYNTTTRWLGKERTAFDESIRSVRFANVA
jgi:hypothetical protein